MRRHSDTDMFRLPIWTCPDLIFLHRNSRIWTCPEYWSGFHIFTWNWVMLDLWFLLVPSTNRLAWTFWAASSRLLNWLWLAVSAGRAVTKVGGNECNTSTPGWCIGWALRTPRHTWWPGLIGPLLQVACLKFPAFLLSVRRLARPGTDSPCSKEG